MPKKINYNELEGIRVSEIVRLCVDSIDAYLHKKIDTKKTDAMRLGSILHAIILRRGGVFDANLPKIIEVMDYATWMAKESKEAKKRYMECEDDSYLPILECELKSLEQGLELSQEAIDKIFENGSFEKAFQGELEGYGKIKGRVDCIKDNCIYDLKTTTSLDNLDKKIFDSGYQLQMYLYMQLAKVEQAKLVFYNYQTGNIAIKELDLFEIKEECETLLQWGLKQQKTIEMLEAYKEPYVTTTKYIPPQWAIANLLEKAKQ